MLLVGSRIKSGSEFQAIGPATVRIFFTSLHIIYPAVRNTIAMRELKMCNLQQESSLIITGVGAWLRGGRQSARVCFE